MAESAATSGAVTPSHLKPADQGVGTRASPSPRGRATSTNWSSAWRSTTTSCCRQYVDGADRSPSRRHSPPWPTHRAAAGCTRSTSARRLTGVGVATSSTALTPYLPADRLHPEKALHASVFKIERGPAGHKVAYARLHAGTLSARDHVVYFHRGRRRAARSGRTGRAPDREYLHPRRARRRPARAGDIAKIVGLADVEIGDQLGRWDPARAAAIRRHRPRGRRPARDPADRPALFDALRS